MRVVMLDAPEELIAERERLGLDGRDEMWEGEYHMVPPSNDEHQRIGTRLVTLFVPLADELGLEFRYEEGVYDPDPSNPPSWRVPDQVIFRREHRGDRGVEGVAELVIEIRSPGDETYLKLPFYERVGARELLVIHRDTKAVEHWVRQGDRLVATDDDVVSLLAVPARLWTEGTQLVVETAAGIHRI